MEVRMGTYDDANADDLRKQAKDRELATSGTKAELVARLEAADAEKETAEKAAASPMLADDGTVDVDAMYAFAADLRALVDEIRERLDNEVRQPLADTAAGAAVPQPVALIGAGQRLQLHLDDVYRALDGLAAGAARLAQDAVA